MTNAYVKVGIDLNHIESISTSSSVEHTVEVVLDNDFVDFSKVNGYVGFVAKERVDGKLILPEAVQILKIGSTAKA